MIHFPSPKPLCRTYFVVLILGTSLAGPITGAEPSLNMANIPLRTLGGSQFWSDVYFEQGWRIQQHAHTTHFRLLDPADVRRAWGDLASCKQTLQNALATFQKEPVGNVVLVLHGLGRTRKSMRGIAQHLRQELGHSVVNVSYASSRLTIEHLLSVRFSDM